MPSRSIKISLIAVLLAHSMISTVLSSHFRGGIIMVRPNFDEAEGSGGRGPVMPVQEYQVSH